MRCYESLLLQSWPQLVFHTSCPWGILICNFTWFKRVDVIVSGEVYKVTTLGQRWQTLPFGSGRSQERWEELDVGPWFVESSWSLLFYIIVIYVSFDFSASASGVLSYPPSISQHEAIELGILNRSGHRDVALFKILRAPKVWSFRPGSSPRL